MFNGTLNYSLIVCFRYEIWLLKENTNTFLAFNFLTKIYFESNRTQCQNYLTLLAIAANFVFGYFSSCSLETGQIKPTCRKSTSTMIEEWLGGWSKNDNLSCLHDAFFAMIRNIQFNKQAKLLSSMQKKKKKKIRWKDILVWSGFVNTPKTD